MHPRHQPQQTAVNGSRRRPAHILTCSCTSQWTASHCPADLLEPCRCMFPWYWLGHQGHGKNGLRVGGACSASWSSTCFLAASFMPSCMPPSKDAIASRIKLEVSIARTLMLQKARAKTTWQHDLSSVLYIAFRSVMIISNAGIEGFAIDWRTSCDLFDAFDYSNIFKFMLYVCDGLLAFQINNS